MTEYTRTFRTTTRPKLTFAQAIERHRMVADMVEASSHTAQALTPIWEAMTGAHVPNPTLLHDAVDLTVPTAHAQILQRPESVPAAFAFCAALAALEHVDLADDMAVRDALTQAWGVFEQRRLAANTIREGFGCDDSPSWHTLRDLQETPDSDDFRQKMIEIAALAGKMFDAFGAMTRKAPSDDPHKVVGATTGGKPERLLPSEIAKLANPKLKTQTEMKILRDQAQVRDLKGETEKTRGPMVVLRDESSSMHEEYGEGRGRNTWAAACAIALTRLAWQENRTVRVVHFASATVAQDMPTGDTRAMFEMARSFLGGGTAFDTALNVAFDEVGDLEANGHEGADVVCITDGSEFDGAHYRQRRDRVRANLNETLDRMDAAGVKLWTVGIGQQHDVEFPLRKRAERWVFAHDRDLVQHDRAADLAAALSDAAKANDPTVN